MANLNYSPVEIPSDQTGNFTRTETTTATGHPSGKDVTHSYTLPKVSANGKAGSVTIVNGIVTSYVLPT